MSADRHRGRAGALTFYGVERVGAAVRIDRTEFACETMPDTSVAFADDVVAAARDAAAVVNFWREAGQAAWFAHDPAFDALFRGRFIALHEAAADGALAGWVGTATGSLALLILIDQFPRNAFRGTPRMYATDAAARDVADRAIRAGHHRAVEREMMVLFVLPFAHSERLADQDRSVALAATLGEPVLSRSQHHREIVERFGRFPHRNAILGRSTTPAEQDFLDAGGFAG